MGRTSLALERLDEARQEPAKGDHVLWREGAEHPPFDRVDPLTAGERGARRYLLNCRLNADPALP
jgi:hypothetical protein